MAPEHRDLPDRVTPKSRSPSSLIYLTIMKGGGVPFGRPFIAGLSSLTERVVKALRQKSFFGFETMEKVAGKQASNKFTRFGAAPYRGRHKRR